MSDEFICEYCNKDISETGCIHYSDDDYYDTEEPEPKRFRTGKHGGGPLLNGDNLCDAKPELIVESVNRFRKSPKTYTEADLQKAKIEVLDEVRKKLHLMPIINAESQIGWIPCMRRSKIDVAINRVKATIEETK